MIDIHTHIIPDVDDGSESYEETYDMIKTAIQVGFTDIITTSHYINEYYTSIAEEREEVLKNIKQYIIENELKMNVYNGSEIYVSFDMVELLKNNIVSSLAGSKYVLFELPMNSRLLYLEYCIHELKANGYIPIVAHPERYKYVQEKPEILKEWREKGVKFQSNYLSLIGYYGKEAEKTLKKLLKLDLIDFLGTDAHSAIHYEKIPECIKVLKTCVTAEKFEQLTTTNALKIIKNELE